MSEFTALGTTWVIEDRGVQVLLITLGRDAFSVVENAKYRGWVAREATTDEFPPAVPEECVVVDVPVEKFEAFLRDYANDGEDQFIFPSIEEARRFEDIEFLYETTAYGAAFRAMQDAS